MFILNTYDLGLEKAAQSVATTSHLYQKSFTERNGASNRC